jgi:hypothetical protein
VLKCSGSGGASDGPRQTLAGTLHHLVRNPVTLLVHGWNWKSAYLSSLSRSIVFFLTNLSAGLEAATGALIAEFVYRAVTAGFYGALVQTFRLSEPRWAASLAVMLGLPAFSHSLEFLVHWLRETPNLKSSIAASVLFTAVSTAFHLHAMRRGVFIVGRGEKSLAGDLRSLPAVIWTFVTSGFGLLSPSAKTP